MTEFELATTFVQGFAEAAAMAAEAGRSVCMAREFRSYCRGFGLRATAERFELVRDLGAVLAEELVRMDAGALDAADAAGSTTVTATSLVDGLERHGWRLEFLAGRV